MSGRSKTNREVEAPEEPEHDGSKLPEGWCDVRLVDLLKPNGLFDGPFGSNLKTSDYSETGVRVIRLENLGNLKFYDDKRTFIRRDKYESLLKHTVVPGDIIFGSFVDQRVRVCILPHLEVPAIAKADCFCIRPIMELVDSRFLTFALGRDRTRDELVEQIHGATRPRINTTQLREHRLPLAPLAEQRRIVAKLEQLLAKVSSSQQHLSRIPSLLKRFRQSVLAAACSGRLTADWREENPPPALTIAEADTTESGIPESWTIATVRDVIDGLKYGTSQKCDYPKRGVPVLRIPNIAAGVIDHSDMKYAELESAEFEQLRLRTGDVLLIRSNGSISLVGKTALVREAEHDFAYAGYLIRLRPNRAKITPEFLNTTLGSYNVRLQIEIPARSTSGVNNINSEEVRALRIPLPPLAEQHEIVRRVEKLFAFADQIEARLKHAQAHVERLTQSLLAKAFRGELVPTEHALAEREGREYETAEQLLARIRAVKTDERPGVKKKGRRRTVTQP